MEPRVKDYSGGASCSVDNNGTIHLEGALTREEVSHLCREASGIGAHLEGSNRIDLSGVTDVDGAGVAYLCWLVEKRPDASFFGEPESVARARELYGTQDTLPEPPLEERNLFARTGSMAIAGIRSGREYLQLAADVSHWIIPGLFPNSHQRRGSYIDQTIRIGTESIGIVAILSFIIGFILALQSAVQLVQFGAGIFVADLLAVSVIREMGPMMTAIIVAGRSGSSVASEIATMKVTEELDALEVMGINPVRYTVVPRILAGLTALPILTLVSIVASLLGGGIVSILYLNLSPAIFVTQLSRAVGFGDLLIALIKSMVFAWQIVLVAGFFGLRAGGGAEGVGKVTTSSVVASIFGVIVVDVFFSFLYIL